MKTILVWVILILSAPLLVVWLPFLAVMMPERWE